MKSATWIVIAVIAAATPVSGPPAAQAAPDEESAVVRDILETAPIESRVPQSAVTGLVVFPPGSSAGHHIHHGIESGYVLSGEVEIVRDGEGSHIYRAGETFVTTRDHAHLSRNRGDVEARAVVTWIVDADAPLTIPVSG